VLSAFVGDLVEICGFRCPIVISLCISSGLESLRDNEFDARIGAQTLSGKRRVRRGT
jgi:hypothetical protein